jgi:hypothetical protein
MAAERLSMRKVREVLRLKHALGMSYRRISAATGVGKTQAADYVHRAALSGITWPVPEGLDDAELERRLFPVADFGASGRPAIDWPAIQCELKRRSVTLALLWQEYLAEHPNGYSYTRFCELYADWRRHVSPTMAGLPNPYSHPTGIIERRSACDSDPFSFRFGYDPGGLRRR